MNRVAMQKVLMKLSICLFWLKMVSCWKNTIKLWAKVSNNIKKGFDIEPVYNENELKTY